MLRVTSLVSRRASLFLLAASFLTGCASESLKSAESLDETTGMTRAALLRPLAFVETGIQDVLEHDRQPSVIYLGPEERDQSGDYSYVLWVQLAPGVDGHRIGDLRAAGAISLKLDDGMQNLVPLDQPVTASSPYVPVAPVGQSVYFSADVALLKRMATSHNIVLEVRSGDLSKVDFIPYRETSDVFQQFIIDRQIGGD